MRGFCLVIRGVDLAGLIARVPAFVLAGKVFRRVIASYVLVLSSGSAPDGDPGVIDIRFPFLSQYQPRLITVIKYKHSNEDSQFS